MPFYHRYASARNVCYFALLGLLLCDMVQAQNYQPNWQSLDKRATPAWFDEAKFGIFIHWGLYSVPAWAPTQKDSSAQKWGNTIHYAEWYWKLLNEKVGSFSDHHAKVYGSNFQYPDFAKDFKAQYFDPAQWVNVLAKSGAKYVVLTSKHHEGFTLWPNRYSKGWNAAETGPKQDLAGKLGKAIKAKGLRMGYYYSLYEWYNPLYKGNPEQYVDAYMLPQMKELVMAYEPDVLWTDGEWDHESSKWRSEEFLAWLYNQSPVKDRVAVNDRWGKETRSKHGGFYTTEYGQAAEGKGITEEAARHKWEETRGIGRSFGYNRVEDINDYLSGEQLVHMLVEIVSKGGNLLLNIGPTADGLIPVIMQQRLLEVGDWLQINGEAIYGTSPWQRQGTFTGVSQPGKTPAVYYTTQKNNLFAICTQWPNKALVVEGIKAKVTSVSLLGSSEKPKWEMKNGQLLIEPPLVSPSGLNTKYAYVFKVVTAH